ncbi:MAG: RNA polymerase sigma-70 factor [Anaerolineales bacterium]
MPPTDSFTSYRPLLFSIAYRMLGTVMDAEDVLQEAFLRWQRAPVEEVDNPRAYLSAVVTRLCIDHLRSARVQREEYIGPWLPEPLIMNDPAPLEATILAESLSTAFLVLLENLNPVERAVYLLREVFDYDYAEIAKIVDKSEENCRQVFSRAKKYITERRPRFEPDPAQEQRLMGRFMETLASGDMDGLLEILAQEIVVYSDGGGKAFAAKKPVVGVVKVARFFFGLVKQIPPGWEVRFARSNGLPALVNLINGVPHSVMAFQMFDGRIQNVFVVVNPEKLRGVQRISQKDSPGHDKIRRHEF